eukprot:240947_1
MALQSTNIDNFMHILLLVSGYAREIENCNLSIVIPQPIVNLIFDYYAKQFTVYGIGKNEYGEFGINDNREIFKYEILPKFSELLHDINEIYWGSWRFMIKHHPNIIYSVGANDDGDCGVGEQYKTKTRIENFTPIDLSLIDFKQDEFIEIISYGFTSYHTFMSTNYNRIIAFGSNGGKRIEPISDERTFRTPFLPSINNILSNIKLKQIECGIYFTLFVCTNGSVYSFGSNTYGNCGIDINITKSVLIPTIIPLLNNVKYLRCGSQHTIAICNEYQLYVFGKCSSFELGLGEIDKKAIYKPILHPYFKNIQIKYIDCGDAQSLVIDNKGRCWTFGDNHSGQCGTENGYHVYNPLLFQLNQTFKNVNIKFGSCGYSHTVLLNKNCEIIYTFGSNDYHEVDPTQPKHIDIKIPKIITKDIIGVDHNYVIESVYAGDHVTIVIGYQT